MKQSQLGRKSPVLLVLEECQGLGWAMAIVQTGDTVYLDFCFVPKIISGLPLQKSP